MAAYSSFFNEEGEPLMSGEDMRAEMAAADAYDEPWQYEYDDNDLSDDWDEDDAPEYDDEDSEPWEDEDGWLDGSYEE